MKKIILILFALFALFISCPATLAETDNIALLAKNGFFDRAPQPRNFSNPYEEVKKALLTHLKYSNAYNIEGLRTLYADNYINADGFSKEVYFDLIKKTWESYPDIKYRIEIKGVDADGNLAVAQVNEYAIATTNSKSTMIAEKGLLQSSSSSVYYFEKIGPEWKITSDHILFEKTYLRYGSAQFSQIDLSAPSQVSADTPYTATLNIVPPKNTLVIASIGKETITYPQVVAEEVFKKLPESGVLERIFKSNNQNINEYAVASFGITKAELKNNTDIKIYITGLGFVMSRVNVIPVNNFIKVTKDEKTK